MREFSLRNQWHRQRGITLFGAIFVMIILGGLALLGMKVVPAVTEFREVQNAILKARDGAASVADVRRNFDMASAAGYISSVTGKDLDVTKENDKIVVSVAYSKKIPIMEPVSLVIDFNTTTRGKP
jgi:type II secretory pathway pseudopilin PulG